MRKALSDSLLRAAQNNPKVILLTGDHGYALFDEFRKYFPDQYLNAGIAEQNMVGMAAGLARGGYLPIVYGLSAFIPVRVLEQIKLDVCHDNLPVIFLGDGAGFVYSSFGTSHQSTEDIACTRAIPNLNIFSPADRFEMKAVMDLSLDLKLPSYIRIGKSDVGDVHSAELVPTPASLLKIKDVINSKISIIATGSMVKMALNAVNAEIIQASVWSAPSIKPINVSQVVDLCKGSDLIITMEEHSVYGGLGSVVAEIACEFAPLKVLRIGVKDRFSHYCGTYEYLLKEHNLDLYSITNQINRFIAVE